MKIGGFSQSNSYRTKVGGNADNNLTINDRHKNGNI